ncbi:hypothetical protein G3O08_05995 [Cryomorpha ignava]|uniref:Uncharacterized protein n=1 Tax=Cryomorpha ignava TaxID=101383 RepID=A0A7K3WN27_9FLAO|nr:hypothetical protein [Cryomorpha ignava]
MGRFSSGGEYFVIGDYEYVFFTDHGDISVLNHVLTYIRENEHARKLKIVWIIENAENLSAKALRDIDDLDRAYPDIKIEVVEEKGTFGPSKIKELSNRWKFRSILCLSVLQAISFRIV